MPSAPLLEVTDLWAGYGKMAVVRGVSLEVSEGELVSLVGRNGVGKTTTLMALAGVVFGRPSGSVRLNGQEVLGWAPERLVRAGLAAVPEGRRIFRSMTVRENLELGAFLSRRSGKRDLAKRIGQVFEIFPALAAEAGRKAGELSGGQQQMVAMGQGLMSRPRLMLLDEPCGGLAPAAIEAMYERVAALRNLGIGMLIVEQNISSALAISSRCYVMEAGRIAFSGPSEALRGERKVADIIRGAFRVGGAKTVPQCLSPRPPQLMRNDRSGEDIRNHNYKALLGAFAVNGRKRCK
jgi:branched-chain amino acid transport system ATP-binding protein